MAVLGDVCYRQLELCASVALSAWAAADHSVCGCVM